MDIAFLSFLMLTKHFHSSGICTMTTSLPSSKMTQHTAPDLEHKHRVTFCTCPAALSELPLHTTLSQQCGGQAKSWLGRIHLHTHTHPSLAPGHISSFSVNVQSGRSLHGPYCVKAQPPEWDGPGLWEQLEGLEAQLLQDTPSQTLGQLGPHRESED